MLFNSLQFALFFLLVYSLYLILNHKQQNRMMLIASCIFYGAWDWRFLFLIFVSITVDYFSSLRIYDSDDERVRRRFLFISVFINLSILLFFKYFNFFSDSLRIFLGYFGINMQTHFLKIILPVGISFYTFQTMSYTCDVYRKKMKPVRSFLDYALFVSYFPQLVAGPIMRARNLLPQILSPRVLSLSKFYEGCYLIFWGLFQKVFIADNLAKIVDPVFENGASYNGILVLIAVYAFAFQIFCDFAGYSNIARGLGKCMGFDIMVNFNLPYFSTSPKEFWQRWHISLSAWLKDYLYIPLGGNRGGRLKTCRNIIITMFLGGLWHGASWTFVIWGLYHSFLIIIYRAAAFLRKKIPFSEGLLPGRALFFLKAVFFFHLVCLGWLIFRSESLLQAYNMLQALVFNFRFVYFPDLRYTIMQVFFYTCFLLGVQLAQFQRDDLLFILKSTTVKRSLFYYIIFYSLLIYGASGSREFIYFQF